MKPTDNSPWGRLVAAARHAPADTDASSPFGFSTRVAARAFAAERPPGASALFLRFSLPALGVAVLITTLAVVTSLKPVLERTDDDVATLSEPVTDSGDLSV